MNSQIATKNNTLVFSKWSRKNYAIFASLSKVVKIARVSVDICISSLTKNKSILRFLKQENQLLISELDAEEKNQLNSDWLSILLFELGLIKLDEPCGSSANIFLNNKGPYLA